MAIKFEDIRPDPKPRKADAPSVAREPDAEALEASVKPELPHAKPEKKPRGRKRPAT